MSYTQFYDNYGMVLRSGKKINTIENSDMYHDFIRVKNGSYSGKYEHYDLPCKKAFMLFEFLEKYFETMRSKFSSRRNQTTLFGFYKEVVKYTKEVVLRKLNSPNCQCLCRFNKLEGYAYPILFMDYEQLYKDRIYNVYRDPYLGKMETYSGFEDREMYRLYHLNFIHFVNPSTNDEPETGLVDDMGRQLITLHNIDIIIQELQHWLKYFNNPRAYIV